MLNFPNNPTIGDTYTSNSTVWEWDGVVWNIVQSDSNRNIFTTVNADTGNTSPDVIDDVLNIVGGNNVTTSITGKTLTINSSGTTQNLFSTIASSSGSATASSATDTLTVVGGNNVTTSITGKTLTISSSGTTQNLFSTIASDDGSTTANSATDTLSILGGTHISTAIATDTDNVTINLDAFSIDFLSDVDTTSTPPTTGQVLKWNGTNWAPGADVASGGAGLDADTLDGFDSSYYLNYNNLTNKPTVATLTSFSVGNELPAAGDGAISYDNTTGVFRYTPPDLSSYLTTVSFADITSKPTTISGYGITDAFDGAYSSLTGAPDSILDFNITDGSAGQVLTTNGAGGFSFTTVTSGGDGATTFLQLTDTPATFGTAGQVVTINGTGNGLIFANSTGEANQNAFSTVAVSGQTDVTADTSTDTLTLAAGSNITLTTSGNTVTIAASSGVNNFSALGDANTATLTVDKIYEPAIAMLRVDNVSATAYTFLSHYAGNNPTIYALAGTTIAFDLDGIAGHPFEIQDGLGDPYNTGLVHVDSSGNVSVGMMAQGKSAGTLYWRIPESISGGYRYQCQLHSAMVGAITIKRLSVI